MQKVHDNLPIILAGVLSILLHAFVLFPALGLIGSSPLSLEGRRTGLATGELNLEDPAGELSKSEHARAERRAEQARRALQERRERERENRAEEPEEKVRLGIDESSAETMNWIGYDEYQQHLAELAEVEQAAFRLEAASGSRGTASPLLPPTPPAPTVAVSPDPSPLPLPAAADGAAGAPASTLVPDPAVASATEPPATPPTEPADTRGADLESARPLPPPDGAAKDPTDAPEPTDAPAPSDPTVPDAGPSPEAPSPEVPTPTPSTDPNAIAPPPIDPSRTDPQAPPVEDPTERPDPSESDPLKRLDPATPGTTPASDPRETQPADDPTKRPPIETTRVDDATRREVDAAGSDLRAPRDQRPIDSEGTRGGGIDGPQPSDGAASEPAKPSPAGEPGDTAARAGELSDRESDPTSIIDVPMNHWQNGRPLAAKGIVLKPVRPRFTALNYLDGVGRNPVGELVFGRDGVPQQAKVLRSTGNPGADEAIRSALFKWRASGRQLERLKPGQTVTIRLRIIMLVD